MSKEPDKLIFIAVSTVVVLLVTFTVGMQSGAKKTFAYRAFTKAEAALKLFWKEKVKQSALDEPIHFLQPARHSGSGVTVNEEPDDGSLILLSGFMEDGNQLRLIRRDGTIVAKWPVRFSDHFAELLHLVDQPQTDWNVDLHGALALPDGSVVFNYEYAGTVKLSRCGEVIWKIAHPTHHSVEKAISGGFWIPGRDYISADGNTHFPPFTTVKEAGRYSDDLILKVSEDGRIEFNKSVAEILVDNGLEPLMTATGYNFARSELFDREFVHLNKIGQLKVDVADAFQDFDAGDLVLSLRNYNLVLVVDPQSWRIEWHRTGPWRRQHDPEFNSDGTITVFNNNSYKSGGPPTINDVQDVGHGSNIIRVDPSTADYQIAYGDRSEEAFFSVIRGKHDLMPGGGFLITEFEAGRAFEVDADRNVVWEYINRYDSENVLELTEARAYPADYFTVDDWRCP